MFYFSKNKQSIPIVIIDNRTSAIEFFHR